MKTSDHFKKKILLVEDQSFIAKNIALSLSKNYEILHVRSYSGAQSKSLEDIDLIILDIALGDGSGLDLYHVFKSRKDIPVIFLTARNDEDTVVRALDMGADDYITKPFTLGELKARIRKVLPDFLSFGDIEIDEKQHAVYQNGKVIETGGNEYELLTYFIKNKNVLLTRERLLRLWEIHNSYINDNTLSVNIKRLREKFGLSSLITVKNKGYILNEEEK